VCVGPSSYWTLPMTQPPSNGEHFRMPELDGLRGFAILQVVSIHYFYNPTANFPQGCISFRAFLLWAGPVSTYSSSCRGF